MSAQISIPRDVALEFCGLGPISFFWPLLCYAWVYFHIFIQLMLRHLPYLSRFMGGFVRARYCHGRADDFGREVGYRNRYWDFEQCSWVPYTPLLWLQDVDALAFRSLCRWYRCCSAFGHSIHMFPRWSRWCSHGQQCYWFPYWNKHSGNFQSKAYASSSCRYGWGVPRKGCSVRKNLSVFSISKLSILFIV